MALFNLSNIGNIHEGSSSDDIRKIKAHLFQLNDQLKYMFSNLSPEDNYKSKSLIRYQEDGKRISELEFSLDGMKVHVANTDGNVARLEVRAGMIEQSVRNTQGRVSSIKVTVDNIALTMVNKNNIITTINLSKEGVYIKGNKIKLEGTVTANNNFIIDTDGTMHCRNANISGTIRGAKIESSIIRAANIEGSNIRAANIEGATITSQVEIQCGKFWVNGVGSEDSGINQENYEIIIGGFKFVKAIRDGRNVHAMMDISGRRQGENIFIDSTNGWIECDNIKVGRSWLAGTLADLYNKIDDLQDQINSRG